VSSGCSLPSECPTPRGGHRCKSRRCPSCGLLWAGDQRKKLLVNISAYGGAVGLLTLTAPGSAELPDQAAMWRWNSTAARRWTRMHRLASQTAKRRHGAFTFIGWTWEYQRRGALHKHAILGMESARERAAAHTYALAMEELRQEHGFGFIDGGRRDWRRGGLEVIAAERAARYVAKYVSPLDRRTGKPTLSETVMRPDVPALVVYVSRELTSATGVTMRFLRRVRLCWVLGIDPVTGELVNAVVMAAPEAPSTSPPPARAP
jgi:hypothetical protein